MNGSFGGGDGSTGNPYLIEDALDLDAIRNNLSKAYKLIKNIDLNIAPYNAGTGWNPIGNTDNIFTGIFNGNGHIIKNLYINSPKSNIGLFGYISAATIKNLGLENINITATNSNYVGCFGYITNSSHISNCYSTGNINGNNSVGGLIGCNNSNTIISNCYSSCNINANSNGGGLVGANQNGGKIINCYSIGLISGGSGGRVNGFLGYNNGTVTNSYWDKETSGNAASSGGETGLTTAQMKTASSFVNWNTQLADDGITPVWILKDGDYPKLYFEKAPAEYLLKQNNQYYSIKEEYYDESLDNYGAHIIDDLIPSNFDDYGLEDLSTIHSNALLKLIENKYNIAMLV